MTMDTACCTVLTNEVFATISRFSSPLIISKSNFFDQKQAARELVSIVPRYIHKSTTMKQSSRKRRPQQHHVFVFRHCVRSTGSIVKLQPFLHPIMNSTTKKGNSNANIEQEDQEQYSYNASDFTASPLPLWNTPDMWCTEGGMAIMKETGKFLWNNKIHTGIIPTDSDNDTLRIKFQLVTDTSQRDVDTSFALAEGLSEAALASAVAEESIVIDGLDDIVYDPVLFSPLENNTHWQSSRTTRTGGPLCETFFTQEQLDRDINLRYQQVPPPEPGLVPTLQLLRNLGGVGPMGPPPKNEENEIGYEKYVNVVKIFAQMMFYSRASGIQPPFLPNATRAEVYRLLDWVHWMRSVLNIDNVESVTDGAVLAHAILEVLETGQYNGGSDRSDHLDGAIQEDEDDYDIRITIIVGHDGNQNTLASALGVRWQLPAPYQSRLQDSATPPGSALHFSHDMDSGSLEMSFLYPVFGTDWALDQNRAMGSVPLLLVDSSQSSDTLSNAVKVDKDAGATEIGASDDGRSGVQLLREHLFSVLREYPGAMECYDAAVLRTVSSSSPMMHVDSNANKINWLIAGTLIGNAFLILCFFITRKKRPTKQKKKKHCVQTETITPYESVSSNLEIT